MGDFGDAIKARMQSMGDALDTSELDSSTDQVRAPVRDDEVDGIITRYGFGSEPPKDVYPKGYPITFPGIYPSFGSELPGVAYRSDTFLDFLLRALGAEMSAATNLGQVWFEWNGVDLTEFDSLVYGSQVSTGSRALVNIAGTNWVQISSTSTGTPGSEISTATILPVSTAPPSADYVVFADFLSVVQAGTIAGAYVFARFASVSSSYLVRFHDASTANPQEVKKLTTGETVNNLGVAQSDLTYIAVNTGMTLGISAEGSTIIKSQLGEVQIIADTSSPITAVGKAAIGVSPGSAVSATATCAFRNIRCIEVLT